MKLEVHRVRIENNFVNFFVIIVIDIVAVSSSKLTCNRRWTDDYDVVV